MCFVVSISLVLLPSNSREKDDIFCRRRVTTPKVHTHTHMFHFPPRRSNRRNMGTSNIFYHRRLNDSYQQVKQKKNIYMYAVFLFIILAFVIHAVYILSFQKCMYKWKKINTYKYTYIYRDREGEIDICFLAGHCTNELGCVRASVAVACPSLVLNHRCLSNRTRRVDDRGSHSLLPIELGGPQGLKQRAAAPTPLQVESTSPQRESWCNKMDTAQPNRMGHLPMGI